MGAEKWLKNKWPSGDSKKDLGPGKVLGMILFAHRLTKLALFMAGENQALPLGLRGSIKINS
jgi:hypothetical protein